MNERIKQLRKHLKLTQQEFADKIGVKRNTIAQYETGRNEPIESIFSLICREFNVNDIWLRTGEGEMFKQMSRNERTAACIGRIMSDEDEPLKELFLNVAAEIIDDDTCFNIIKAKLLSVINGTNERTK